MTADNSLTGGVGAAGEKRTVSRNYHFRQIEEAMRRLKDNLVPTRTIVEQPLTAGLSCMP
jgi:RNase P protein component